MSNDSSAVKKRPLETEAEEPIVTTAADVKKVKTNTCQSTKKSDIKFDRRNRNPDQGPHEGSYASTHTEEMKAYEVNPVPSTPKKRYAVLFGFFGENYSGMQINPGVKSIEAELERALYLGGAIAATNFGHLQKIGWSRAARTDKGVHAAGQVMTAKLHIDETQEQAFIDRVNTSYLPKDIQILALARTTKSFNAKLSCDRRTYEYVLPSFVFASPEELDPKNLQGFCMSLELLKKVNQVFAQYKGTHNFHNFTSQLQPRDPKCKRFIISFHASKIVLDADAEKDTTEEEGSKMEWLKLRVVGQSFLLHHIRKMIGLAIQVCRCAHATPVSIIQRAFELRKMDLPKAPGSGLYLARAHFEQYSKKNPDRPSLDFTTEDSTRRVAVFTRAIQAHIRAQECQDQVFQHWVTSLDPNPTFEQFEFDIWQQTKERQAREKRVHDDDDAQ